MRCLPVILSFFLFVSCTGKNEVNLESISLENLNGRVENLKSLSGSGLSVLIFMSPDCPLCINYTKTIMEMKNQFRNENLVFLAVYSGKYYEKEEMLKFHDDYAFTLQGYLDPEFQLARKVSATVTPEAVVINNQGQVVYSGAIDDWVYETGKKRPVINKHYLKDAISNTIKGLPPDPSRTEPIGCFIEL